MWLITTHKFDADTADLGETVAVVINVLHIAHLLFCQYGWNHPETVSTH